MFKTAAGQRTLLYKTTTLWNNIDPDLKLCTPFLSFKIELKHNLPEQYLDNFMD